MQLLPDGESDLLLNRPGVQDAAADQLVCKVHVQVVAGVLNCPCGERRLTFNLRKELAERPLAGTEVRPAVADLAPEGNDGVLSGRAGTTSVEVVEETAQLTSLLGRALALGRLEESPEVDGWIVFVQCIGIVAIGKGAEESIG